MPGADVVNAEGMFISYFQESYKNLGNRDYIFQRTSDGLYTDQKFLEMLPQVKTVECRGAVHNFRPDKDWVEQVDLFLELSSGKGFRALCGDYESGVLNEQAAKDFWCFLRRLEEQRPAKKIIFYTTIYILRDNLMKYQGLSTVYGPIDWEYFDLWLAQYPIIEHADGTTSLLPGVDPQTHVPYLSIDGVVVRKKPQKFLQYWADGNQKGAEFGCGSRDTNLDVHNGTVEELKEWFSLEAPDSPSEENDCEDLIAAAVDEVTMRYETQIKEMQAIHADELRDVIIQANNAALENLIKPHLM